MGVILFWNANRMLILTCIIGASSLVLFAENSNFSYVVASSSSSSMVPESNDRNDTNLSSNESSSLTSVLSNVSTGKTRTYYIAADEVTWNYTTTTGNINNITGKPFTDKEMMFVMSGPEQIGQTSE